jgi:hypothetical protein
MGASAMPKHSGYALFCKVRYQSHTNELGGVVNIGIKRTTQIIGITVILLAASAAPASAALVRVFERSDYASWDTANGWVEVCDMEEDGNAVYAQFYYSTTSYATVYDDNGSQAGCGNTYVSPSYKFRVCEDFAGPDWCSDWAHLT